MVGQAIQQGPGEAFGAEHLGPLIERQIAGHQGGAALVPLAEHFEQKFGAGFAERDEAELVDDQKAVRRQLLLQAQQALLVPCLHQFVNQGGGRYEPMTTSWTKCRSQTLSKSIQKYPEPLGPEARRRRIKELSKVCGYGDKTDITFT